MVLIIDEAQNLSVDALEQVRLLTNLETDTQKLLQIILLGQPELRDMLARPELRQLAQRITARYHLTPLERRGDRSLPAPSLRDRRRPALPVRPAAVRRIHAHSGGVPRLINVIAERALLAGYAHDAMLDRARGRPRRARGPAAGEAARPRVRGPRSPGAALGWPGVLALWWRPRPEAVARPGRRRAGDPRDGHRAGVEHALHRDPGTRRQRAGPARARCRGVPGRGVATPAHAVAGAA